MEDKSIRSSICEKELVIFDLSKFSMSQLYDPSIARVRNTAMVKGMDFAQINWKCCESLTSAQPGTELPFFPCHRISPRNFHFSQSGTLQTGICPWRYTKHFREIDGHRWHSWKQFPSFQLLQGICLGLFLRYIHYTNYHSYFLVNNSAPTLQNKSTPYLMYLSGVFYLRHICAKSEQSSKY